MKARRNGGGGSKENNDGSNFECAERAMSRREKAKSSRPSENTLEDTTVGGEERVRCKCISVQTLAVSPPLVFLGALLTLLHAVSSLNLNRCCCHNICKSRYLRCVFCVSKTFLTLSRAHVITDRMALAPFSSYSMVSLHNDALGTLTRLEILSTTHNAGSVNRSTSLASRG